ncbi:MAG: hypothetical protein ACLR4Z_13740 [Butyricicoccaceae bacterium]
MIAAEGLHIRTATARWGVPKSSEKSSPAVGKRAVVRVKDDRVDWERPGRRR